MSLLDRAYSEKRNFVRMKVDTPVSIRVNATDSVIEGICRDLSGGGMLIAVDEALPLDTELTVTVVSQYGHSPMLHAICTIARVEAGPKESHLLGLEIREICAEAEAVDTSEAQTS